MQVTISPSSLSGSIQAPTSKSSMQRACAASLLHRGISKISNPGKSNDDLAAIEVIKSLGAMVETKTDFLAIKSNGIHSIHHQLNCGESGLGIRMFAPIAALSNERITIHGSGSLLSRPMNFFDEIFPKLKVEIQSNNGKLPINIKGPLQPSEIEIDGSLSSQFLTGLLMAYSAADAKNVSIHVNNLNSKPYIDLTLDVMRHFKMKVPENKNHESFYFDAEPHKQNKNEIQYTVEGDWSGGAFLLVAGAIAGDIYVKGLNPRSTQADKAIVNALKKAGAKISIDEQGIHVQKNKLTAFEMDATDCPDLFPPLVALSSYCVGESVLKGVTRLTHKESNRAKTLQEEFAKMNVEINLNGDYMIVKGNTQLKGAQVHSHHDHRIAMACAVAALQATGNTTIEAAEAINKSYPDFFEHLNLLMQ